MKKAFKDLLPTAQAIERLLHPHAEVVIHDLKKNKIAAIFHPLSKRRVGDDSLFSPEEMKQLEPCLGPYEKINWDGRKMKSVSSLIYDEKDQAIGMLCINMDISTLYQIEQFVRELISSGQIQEQPTSLFKDDWQERLHQSVHAYLNQHQLNLNTLNREEKKKLIEHLHRLGAFKAKHAAQYIAQIIGISRASIYNYLSQD